MTAFAIGNAGFDASGEVFTGTPATYMAVSQELAALPRIHRNEFGPRILEKMRRADSDPKGYSYCSYVAKELGTVYVFLSSREARSELRQRLQTLTCAAYVQMQVRRAVGIGTQNLSAPARAHDFLLLEDVDFENAEELRTFARTVFTPPQEQTVDEWGNQTEKI